MSLLRVRALAKNAVRSRQEYTLSDDEHLAEYLAIKIPDDEAGGRKGNNVYKLLTVCTRMNRKVFLI